MTKRIVVEINENTHRKLKAYAIRFGYTISGIIRLHIKMLIKNKKP